MSETPIPPAGMLVGVRDVAGFQAEVVLRVYELILSWPCPACGGDFSCVCDQAEAQLNKCAILEVLGGNETAPV